MKKNLFLETIRRSSPALALLTLAACGDDPASSPPPRPTATLAAGPYTILVDPNRPSLTLSQGESTLLDFPADGLEIGTLPVVDDATNYDPYPIFVPVVLYPPPDVSWLSPTRLDIVEAKTEQITIHLDYGASISATLTLEAKADGRFAANLVPDKGASTIAYFRLRPRAAKDEGFYGLGEYFDAVEHRGRLRAMQLELDSGIESSYNEAHVPVPFLIGTRGWGFFVEDQHPAVFSIAKDAPDLVDAVFGTGVASSKGIRFHLFGAAHPLDVTRHYYDVTGYPRLPARWALGPWVWRDENKDQAEVLGDIAAMREKDLPATGYWIDRPYATGVNTFDFKASQFPDPQAMIDELHASGFRAALWHVPYLDEKDPSTKTLRDEAQAGGYWPLKTSLKLNGWGLPIDFTNPAAYTWWQTLTKKYTTMGIEGFKLDYAEDIAPGIASGRNVWAFADGSDERTMHQGYTLVYHQIYAETLPSDGGFLLCRHGVYGDQTNGPIIWPGDLDASFAKHRETVMDQAGDSYVSVGGLPAALIASLTLGPSGFPFYGSDTGGYRHSPPDKELFTRWFEHTALSTVMQIGNSASTVAWEPDAATGYDDEMLGWYRIYTRLHLRLFPYEWTYAQNLLKDGRAIQRPLGLAYPELGVHPDDEYMFGDDLLVAPITSRGTFKRDVILPAGNWIDWWTGQTYTGGQTITVDAPLGTLPLFLREGGVIPMLRPTIDTLAPTTKPTEVDSYATTPGVLYARIAAGEKRSFVLFDDSSVSAERAGAKITLSSADGTEFKQGALFEIIAQPKAPKAVSLDGMPLTPAATLTDLENAASGYVHIPGDTGGTIYVKMGAGGHTATLDL